MGIKTPTYGKSGEPGPPGTYGKALGNIQQLIVEVYIKNMLDLLEIDELLQLLERFPGGDLLPRFLNEASCATQGLFKPPIKSFLSTFSLEVCGDKGFGIGIPEIKQIPNFWDGSLLARLQPLFVGKIETVLVQIIQRMILKILESIDIGICEAINAQGWGSVSTASGLDEAIAEAFCPDGDEKDLKDTKDNLFKAAGLAGKIPRVGKDDLPILPKNQPHLGAVSDDTFDCLYRVLNSTLSKREVLQLLTTPASQMDSAVLLRISELVNAFCPEFSPVFGTPDLVGAVFVEVFSRPSGEPGLMMNQTPHQRAQYMIRCVSHKMNLISGTIRDKIF